jgi:two-component sensor histidine kinase
MSFSTQRFGAEADHRIANNLASLSSSVRLQSNAIARRAEPYSAQQVCDLLKEISSRIEVTARLHKALASAGHLNGIDLEAFLREICMMMEAIAPEGMVVSSVTCSCDPPIEPNLALSIGHIVAELITNAIKYAHPSGLPVKISIVCHAEGGGMLVEVLDDGVGFPEHFNPATDGGLGLNLIRALARDARLEVQFDHDCLGVRCRLIGPSIHLPGMTTFSGDTVGLGKAFDEAWKAITEEYPDVLDVETSRHELARSFMAAAMSHQGDLTKLAEKALADFRASYLAFEISRRA